MKARQTIQRAVQDHVDTFLDEVRRDIAAIDVSEFVQEREEARELIRAFRSTLMHKQILPPMESNVQEAFERRCKAWLERTEPTS